MKFSVYLLFFFVGSMLISSCSEHIPSKNEQFYLDTADSLKLYEDVTYMKKQLESNEKAQDFLLLTFEDFKQKHEMTDAEVAVLADLMQRHLDLARLLNTVNSAE